MKVAMLHWAFAPIIGGVETHLAMLGPDLVRDGCQVALLTGAVDGRPSEESWQGMYVRRTPLMDLNSLTPASIVAHREEIARELADFIRDVEPELVHVHNMHYFSPEHARALGEICRRRSIPLLLTAHNVWEDLLWQKMLAYREQWDGIIAVSNYIKRELIRAGYPAARIDVVYHGIDTEKFRPGDGERPPELIGRRVIFHPARMSLAKGSDVVVRAGALIRKEFPDVILVLTGTEKTVDWGSYQQGEVEAVRRLIRDLDMEEHVYIRFLPWHEMPAMYRAADIVVYPSRFDEPFGLVMLEAMATARPVVVSRAGGMPEVVQDGVSGLVVPMGDHEALAEAVLSLLRDPALAKSLGERGRHEVERAFTKELMVARTLSLYRRVLDWRPMRGVVGWTK
ncbi:glycosyltransferase family 4 protein [Desulfosoma caldarium]|uniref:Glycosyltransferase involved in cell wall biosynthesis n=1 Tax=Desulfosoma caldarium TaxID=610254 RepID=A0A3N1VUH2_9BACT|nr:glycosyltransferase family 4 protein [Desulfosoma caldarium]ROR03437.1 glycosyltransferase involved in cell wall biosynthesis [Desulfosoma caldarium]